MKTSAKNRRQRGLTLVEILVGLSILSLATGIAGAAIAARAPRLAVDRAADELMTDLKRARLSAEASGEPVLIEADAAGYKIAALGIDRRYAHGVVALWNGREENRLFLAVGLKQAAIAVRLRKQEAEAALSVAAISGRIARED
ncbi:MAG: pilus assembly FimT family protein [Pseudomonadota bacterium]